MNRTETYVYRFYLLCCILQEYFTMILKLSSILETIFFIIYVQMQSHYKHVAFS